MATNLVSKIVEALGPTIVARIASALGLGESSTQKAINGAVPGLLAALISLVSKPAGASKLNDVVARQEPGWLSSLANVIGGSGQNAFVDKGANTLTSLLGGTVVSALTNALGRYAGIGEGSSKSLLALLGPAVLGILGQEQRDRGLDASGLARLLTSQKDSVAAALPSGFSKYLGEAGILDDDWAAKSASRTPYQSTSPSIWPWLLGALALLAIGALLWRLLSPHPQEVVEPKSPSQIEVPYANQLAKLRGVKVGDVDVGELANSAITSLRSSLEGIRDESSAQAALPELTKADSQFDQLRGLLGQLSPETRKTLANLIAAVRPSLDQLIGKALAIPGVGAVIKPVVDTIRSKLDALTAA
jgi:Bacterial protein of unknown function (DUF937)